MKVEETLSFEEYWSDPRFRAKRPRWQRDMAVVDKCGDNCYEATADGEFRQLPSMHWDRENDRESQEAKKKDLRGKRVLVARRFCYFGADAVPIPEHIAFRLPARFHRVNFTEEEKSALRRFLEGLPRGVRGRPRTWSKDDTSWRGRQAWCG